MSQTEDAITIDEHSNDLSVQQTEAEQPVEAEQSIAADQVTNDTTIAEAPDENTTTTEVQETGVTYSQEGESNSTCMICMEEWTIGSEHRLCCLKCGHLFGRSCIERWIKEKGASAKCPTCNKTAKKIDLRDLWCKSVRASDATEIMRLQKLVDDERKLRKQESHISFQYKVRLESLMSDIEKLKRTCIDKQLTIEKQRHVIDLYNQRYAQRLAANTDTGDQEMIDIHSMDADHDSKSVIIEDVAPRELKGLFHFAEKIESSPNGGCKTFTLCPTTCKIIVAQPVPAGTRTIFGSGGYGLRKYSVIDTSIREFIPMHNKQITSIQLKPVGDLILTSSLDKRVRLTSLTNNTCVQTYECVHEPACVAWSAHRDQQFYVGSGNCYLSLYDMRNTSEYIYQTSQRVAHTRLLSIASVRGQDDFNGLIVNDTKGSQFMWLSGESEYADDTIDRGVEHFSAHSLPFEGMMGTTDFDLKTGLALVTTRRSVITPNYTHNLVKLSASQSESGISKVKCKSFRTFYGGRSGELLSQSRIMRHPTLSDSVLVCASDDESHGIRLWDSSDNTVFQTIRTNAFVRDSQLYTPENSNQHMLYTLSDKTLCVYRWDYA